MKYENAFRDSHEDCKDGIYHHVDCVLCGRNPVHILPGTVGEDDWKGSWSCHDCIWMYQAGGIFFTALLGISLLAEGILNLCVVLSTVKIVRHQRPDVIEGEFREPEE